MKKQAILLVVLATLVVLVLWQRRQQQQFVASGPEGSLALEPDRVSRLQIQRPGEEVVVLERIGGGWRLKQPVDYPAQDQAVQTLLTAIEDLALEDMVSSNPDNRHHFEVDSTGTHVQAWEGNTEVLSLVVGKATPDYAHTFVRRADEDEVYRAVGMLTYNFNKKVDDWRDKTILALHQIDIRRVELRYPKEDTRVALALEDSVWTLGGDGEAAVADSATVANLLNAASRLNTVSFATQEDLDAVESEPADFELYLQTDSGEHEVHFWKGESNLWLARRKGSDDVVFSVYDSNLTRLQKKREDFEPKSS